MDFYGATFFPTEAIRPVKKTSVSAKAGGGGVPGVSAGDASGGGNGMIGARIRDLLPVFDASGFTKIAPPTERTVKPRN